MIQPLSKGPILRRFNLYPSLQAPIITNGFPYQKCCQPYPQGQKREKETPQKTTENIPANKLSQYPCRDSRYHSRDYWSTKITHHAPPYKTPANQPSSLIQKEGNIGERLINHYREVPTHHTAWTGGKGICRGAFSINRSCATLSL